MDQQLLELNPTPIFIYEKDSLRLLEANPAFCTQYGYEQHELTNYTVRDLQPEGTQAMAAFQSDGRRKTPSVALRSKTGTTFMVSVVTDGYQREGLNVRVAFIEPQPDKRQTKEGKARDKFSELSYHINNNPLGMIRWNSNFRIVDWSEQTTLKTGYSREEVIGKTLSYVAFYSEKYKQKAEKEMTALRSGQRDKSVFDIKIHHKNRDVIELRFHSSALRNEKHQLVSVLTFVEDVTRSKKAQEKLRESEALFRKLFLEAPSAMVMVNTSNKITRVNESFRKLFGYSREELLGRDLDEVLLSGKEAPKMTPNGLLGRKSYTDVRRYSKDGRELNLLLSIIPVHLDGDPIAGFGIYVDISEQKKYQRQLEKSLEEKRVLLEEIHHRVKNNLAIVSGLLQMQVLNAEDARLTNYLQNSQLRIQSMAMVHEMLYRSKNLSEIEMHQYIPKLVHLIADTLSPADKEIKTEVNSDEFLLNINQAIPCALVMNEVLTNSFEYAFAGQKKGSITVSVIQKDEFVRIEMKDDGRGLPEDFEELRKTSLGMSLIDNLTKQLETHIQIDSGSWGTSFEFAFKKTDQAGSSSANPQW